MKIELTDGRGCQLSAAEPDNSPTLKTFTITEDMIRRAGDSLKIHFRQPILDIQGFWNSDHYRPQMLVPWNIRLDSAAQRQMPFLGFFNLEGINRAAFSLSNVTDDAELVSKLSQSDSEFELVWSIHLSPETQAFDFIADCRPVPFPEAVAAFRQRQIPETPVFPDAAWSPVYCSWYAYHAAFTIPELERNAQLAKKLGFGTFILDDGWCYDTSKRQNVSTVPDWFSDVGDWILSEKKLPDFKSHVKRVQSMGLRYLLWTAPYLVGNRSKLYERLKKENAILWESDDGSAAADPAHPLILNYVVRSILDIFEKYGLDGLKVDFLDYVRPSLDTPRGRECLKTIRTLVHEIRRIRPDALIEFRQRYTAPVMLPYATNFRANDVPFDYLENLHRCCQIRMVLGDGVPVHSDPICFHPEESCVNVARHLIAALAGVPMISADLTKIQPQHLAIIRRFLRFYLAHAETFRNGHWTIRYSFGHVASLSVETEREMIATAVSEIPPLSEGKNIILMSLATHAFPVKTGKSVDCEGNPSKDLPPGGMSSIEP